MGAIHALALAILALLLTSAALAQGFVREPLRISMEGVGPRGLEALLVRPAGTERLPLAVITHGSPSKADDRLTMTPLALIPHALEFARRGWAVAIVMRRGYGDSDHRYVETFGPCEERNYLASAQTSAEELRAAIAHLSTRSDIDVSRIIAIGGSAGGFAVTALTVDPPPGLVATISFAGGRGGRTDKQICDEDRLVAAFWALGTRSRIPMLWVYAENDRLFGPERARRFHDAFTEGGGRAEFIKAPAYRTDGHTLFSPRGIKLWTPYVDMFLKQHNLVLREELLSLPKPPALTPPKQLRENGRKSFADYLISAPHKALAVSSNGSFGWESGKRTVAAAKARALDLCRKHAEDCRVVVVDDAPVRDEVGAR